MEALFPKHSRYVNLINSLFGFLLKAWFSYVRKIPDDPGFYWKRYVRRIRESVRFMVIFSLSIRPSYGDRGEEIFDGGGGRGRRERKA